MSFGVFSPLNHQICFPRRLTALMMILTCASGVLKACKAGKPTKLMAVDAIAECCGKGGWGCRSRWCHRNPRPPEKCWCGTNIPLGLSSWEGDLKPRHDFANFCRSFLKHSNCIVGWIWSTDSMTHAQILHSLQSNGDRQNGTCCWKSILGLRV